MCKARPRAIGRGEGWDELQIRRPAALLAALVIGDQIRINRPNHKYRLTVEVETPEGVKSASGIVAVHPDRSYSRGGKTSTKGDAMFVDLGGGKNLVALLAHIDKTSSRRHQLRGAARLQGRGQRVSFNQMSRMTGTVPVKGEAVPVLVSFADPADPGTRGRWRLTISRPCWERAIASGA